jgi:hypothetical protein
MKERAPCVFFYCAVPVLLYGFRICFPPLRLYSTGISYGTGTVQTAFGSAVFLYYAFSFSFSFRPLGNLRAIHCIILCGTCTVVYSLWFRKAKGVAQGAGK